MEDWKQKNLYIQCRKRLVNGDSYVKSYPFETMIYSLTICYCIVLHMKLSLLMRIVGRNCRIITDYLCKPIGTIGRGAIGATSLI